MMGMAAPDRRLQPARVGVARVIWRRACTAVPDACGDARAAISGHTGILCAALALSSVRRDTAADSLHV